MLLFEVCSLDESPLGELLLDDDECSLVVVDGATSTAGAATTIGAGGAITTGAAYTTAGAGGVVVVSLEELEVSVV